MNQLSIGQRVKVADHIPALTGQIAFHLKSETPLDLICFGLDSNQKLSDERYMVFYNQPKSPDNAIALNGDGTSFEFNFNTLDAKIEHLIFAISTDGPAPLNSLGDNRIVIDNTLEIAFSGAQLGNEKVLMLMTFYKKDGIWRMTSSLQGYEQGLAALVQHFGGEVESNAEAPSAQEAPATAPQPSQISLEKKVADKAPALIDLAKKAQISLEKNNLSNVEARIGLVLDASGSMNNQYKKGRVQELLNRMVPLALHFDDDGGLDCWAFANKTAELSTVTTDNYEDFIDTDNRGWKKWSVGLRGNNEPVAIRRVIDHYRKFNDTTPAYVLFVSDGGVYEDRKIEKLIREAADLPIFWQFVGIGGRDYGVLEKLDDMEGRTIDNCDFFAIDDLHSISEDELYDRMMTEFPSWLKEAKRIGII